jgi:hypothetical protein
MRTTAGGATRSFAQSEHERELGRGSRGVEAVATGPCYLAFAFFQRTGSWKGCAEGKQPGETGSRSGRIPRGVSAIMSGTSSGRASTAVVIRVPRSGARTGGASSSPPASRPYSDALRQAACSRAQAGDAPIPRASSSPVHIEEAEVAAGRRACRGPTPQPPRVSPSVVAGFHGQTVFHDPRGETLGKPLTNQSGEPSVVRGGARVPRGLEFPHGPTSCKEGGARPLCASVRLSPSSPRKTRDPAVLVNHGGISNLTSDSVRRRSPGRSRGRSTAVRATCRLDGIVADARPVGGRASINRGRAPRGEGVAAERTWCGKIPLRSLLRSAGRRRARGARSFAHGYLAR